jgi:hypothetical protein
MLGPEKQFYDAQQEAAAVASGAANAADDDEEDDADSGAAGGGRRGFKSGGSGLVRYSGSGGEGRSTGYGSGFVDGNVAIDPNAQRLNKVYASGVNAGTKDEQILWRLPTHKYNFSSNLTSMFRLVSEPCFMTEHLAFPRFF